MGVRYSCDGCDQMIHEGMQPEFVGTVMRREYCDRCAPLAKEYMSEVSAAHTSIAKAWQEKLDTIRARYAADDKFLKLLPDAN